MSTSQSFLGSLEYPQNHAKDFKSLLKESMVGATTGLHYHRTSFKINVKLIVQDTIFPVKI